MKLKIYVTNIDLKFSEIESMKYILEYIHKRKNIVRTIFWKLMIKKNSEIFGMKLILLLKDEEKYSYIELKKNKDRSDRFRGQLNQGYFNK